MSDPALLKTLTEAWACLEAGAGPGQSRFSMMQFSTIGLDGAPRVRTLVIRSADRETRRIAFHTDRRSPKFKELQADPRVAVIGYDMEAGQQVRLTGEARLHVGDSDALAAWGASRNHSLICYRSDFAPGHQLTDPKLGDPTTADQTPSDGTIGFDKFCRIVVDVNEVDWLDLASSGHRRARHQWAGDAWRSVWLAP